MEDNSEIIENEDGSGFVIEPTPNEQESAPFGANLVETMDRNQLQRLTTDLLELIGYDRDSRKKRDKQYAEGLRRTGLGDDAPGGADFDGASRVVHPVLAEACVDFASAAIKALMPPEGPVKMHQIDRGNQADFARAERKRDFMNWQMTEQMPEYRTELEVLLTQQPLGGSQFLKLWWDAPRQRPGVEFIPIDNVYLPFSANSFSSAGRRTVVVPLDRAEFQRRIASGMYVDIDSYDVPLSAMEESESETANRRIEGKDESGFNEDGLRHIYEVYVWLDFEGELCPYLFSIDQYEEKPLGLYRNWLEGDETFEELQWVVEFDFIPWRGAYGIGLMHLIGGLSASATGALRALLDSAHINNAPGGVRLKGARSTGETIQVNPTEIAEIETPNGIDDIRKVFMGWPFNPPSPVLFQLLGLMVESAKGVVSVAEEKIKDAGNNMPVGTAMALIEEGSKTFSAIHLRLHASQARVIRILQRLNATYPSEQAQIKKFGRVIVTTQDFQQADDIIPVSDPNIFSEAQRYVQVQGLHQLSQDQTVPWNKIEIYRRMLSIMKVENPDAILPSPPTPVSADPEAEIQAAMTGQQLQAQPQMDHAMHLETELKFLLDPVFGAANPTIQSPGFAVVWSDVNAHWQFLRSTLKAQSMQVAQTQAARMIAQQAMANGVPPEAIPMILQQQMTMPVFAQQLTAAADQRYQRLLGSIAPLVQMFNQAAQLVAQRTPQPPMPPEVQATLQLGQADIERRKQLDQATLQLEQQKQTVDTQLEAQKQSQELALAQQEQQFSQFMEQTNRRLESEQSANDNVQHQTTELLKNHEDNQTRLMIEQMRQEGAQQRHELEMQLRNYESKMDAMLELLKRELERGAPGAASSSLENEGVE